MMGAIFAGGKGVSWRLMGEGCIPIPPLFGKAGINGCAGGTSGRLGPRGALIGELGLNGILSPES